MHHEPGGQTGGAFTEAPRSRCNRCISCFGARGAQDAYSIALCRHVGPCRMCSLAAWGWSLQRCGRSWREDTFGFGSRQWPFRNCAVIEGRIGELNRQADAEKGAISSIPSHQFRKNGLLLVCWIPLRHVLPSCVWAAAREGGSSSNQTKHDKPWQTYRSYSKYSY